MCTGSKTFFKLNTNKSNHLYQCFSSLGVYLHCITMPLKKGKKKKGKAKKKVSKSERAKVSTLSCVCFIHPECYKLKIGYFTNEIGCCSLIGCIKA